METVSKSLAQTDGLAQDFLASLKPEAEIATVIGLYGELGTGKTTFVQDVARALGVRETVASPTFVIEKIYRLPLGKRFRQLIHIDAYRLNSGAELLALNFAELANDTNNLILIEWAGRVADVLREHKRIYFKFVDETTRHISW